MNQSKKQLGFALPIAILIVVVLIIAGGAGYYFYKEKKGGGALIWTKTSNPSVANDEAHGVVVDSTGVYIVGWDSSSGYEQWRIEKRKSR